MKQIIIDIAPDGTVKAETKGYAGATCRDGSKFIEQALGKRTGERLTPEFNQTQAQVKQ